MIIRHLNKNDLLQLSALYEQFWGEASDVIKMERQFDKIQSENTHVILVCENKDQIIGSVMGIICRDLYGSCQPFMVVENMIVDKSCRLNGIGKALLHKLEETAKEHNCSQMILVTEKNRTDACSFYESYGFSDNTTGYKMKVI